MAKRRNQLDMVNEKLSDVGQTLRDHEQRIKAMEEREVIRMLEEKNRPNSPRPRYTYQEIADATGMSPASVCNIAADNNLSRRNLKAAE